MRPGNSVQAWTQRLYCSTAFHAYRVILPKLGAIPTSVVPVVRRIARSGKSAQP
jgi:hypothetical protein